MLLYQLWAKPHRRERQLVLFISADIVIPILHSHPIHLSCVYIKYIPVIPINAKAKTEIKIFKWPFSPGRNCCLKSVYGLCCCLLPTWGCRCCRNKGRAQLTWAAGGNLCLFCDAQMSVQRVPEPKKCHKRNLLASAIPSSLSTVPHETAPHTRVGQKLK